MRLSNFFLPVLKETPSEAEIISHQLMMRSGMISQSSSGIYSWLPLGLKVLKKIENIVRDEQNKAVAFAIVTHAAIVCYVVVIIPVHKVFWVLSH